MESVTVIGASIAGLFAAYQLARRGVPVRVYDSQAQFQPSHRTLIVTPTFLRIADLDFSETVQHRINTFELISPKTSVRIRLSEPDLIVDRASLMRFLARKAQDAGAVIEYDHRLETILNHRPVPLLEFTGLHKTVRFPAARVLAADGVKSAVRRAFGRKDYELVELHQVRVRLPSDQSPDVVRVWFDRGLTRFFLWVIPESKTTAAAGLITDVHDNGAEILNRFIAAKGLSLIEIQQSARVPLPPLTLVAKDHHVDGRIFFIGDAAGQVKASTVGGVVAGMRGALAAVRSIIDQTLYPNELASLNRELYLHSLVRRVLDRFTNDDYDELLRSVNSQTASLLGRYNRDGLASVMCRLIIARPKWIIYGVRSFLRQHKERIERAEKEYQPETP